MRNRPGSATSPERRNLSQIHPQADQYRPARRKDCCGIQTHPGQSLQRPPFNNEVRMKTFNHTHRPLAVALGLSFGSVSALAQTSATDADSGAYTSTATTTNEILGDQSTTTDVAPETTMDMDIVNDNSSAVSPARIDPTSPGASTAGGDTNGMDAMGDTPAASAANGDTDQTYPTLGGQASENRGGDS